METRVIQDSRAGQERDQPGGTAQGVWRSRRSTSMRGDLTTQAPDEGIVLAISWMDDAVFVVATVVAGILAAILPARRASRLNILKACSTSDR